MLSDSFILKKCFERECAEKFGSSGLRDDIAILCSRILGKDRFVDNHIYSSLQNILVLNEAKASYFIKLALILAEASAFAPLLLLEKIPALIFYDLSNEVGDFLRKIISYGARAVSMYLGSDHLRTEDLIDVLEQATVPYYHELITTLTRRHSEFAVNCAVIMRFAAKIETVVAQNELGAYLDVCADLNNLFGSDVTEQFIRHSHEVLQFMPLDRILGELEKLGKRSLVAAEFAVTHPKLYFSSCGAIIENLDKQHELTRSEKLWVLEHEDYALALQNCFLDNDPAFAAMLMWWPTTGVSFRKNVLSQLRANNYKNQILEHSDLLTEIKKFAVVTNSNWMGSWLFCQEIVDLAYIRKSIRKMLQAPELFSMPPKTIVHQNKNLFDRCNPDYTNERVRAMAQALMKYCIDDESLLTLELMVSFLQGDRIPLRNHLSHKQLVIESGERNPWSDYGRADELFSCTGIGQYAGDNAPAFISDLNLVNLDVWSAACRVGRIHLCLVNDSEGRVLLLVDCIDGSERILEGEKKIRNLMDAVYSFAHWIGVSEIKLNCSVDFNLTPKKFIDYVVKNFENHDRIDFLSRFASNRANSLLPYPRQSFLEAFQKYHAAFVQGPIIKTFKAVSL